MPVFTFDDNNFSAFKERVKQSRRNGEIGLFQAARIVRFSKRNWDDVMLIAYEVLEVPEGAMSGLIDWENFDVEKFRDFLEAIGDFIKLVMDFFN